MANFVFSMNSHGLWFGPKSVNIAKKGHNACSHLNPVFVDFFQADLTISMYQWKFILSKDFPVQVFAISFTLRASISFLKFESFL